MTRQLNDRPAEGRACGNLGNTHYLLGNYNEAVEFHLKVGISDGLSRSVG